MKTRRNRTLKKRTSRKMTRKLARSKKSGKQWITAIEAAKKTLSKTGDIAKAKISLRKQALTNARKLFGSVTSTM